MQTGEPIAKISDGDAVICFNYRADRVRQITRVLTRRSGLAADGGLSLAEGRGAGRGDSRGEHAARSYYICMTQYDKKFALPMVIPPESMDNLLANVMAKYELRNLRVAETEKYAHVTYFFNGGIEKPFAGEDRELVASKKVATYDLAPEMSAEGIGDIVERAVKDTAFDVVIVNFANADMVGHSGKIEPTVRAVETVDAQLGRIYNAVRGANASWIITADHGNAEMLIDPATRRPAYRAHDESGAVHPGDGARQKYWCARGRVTAGYLAYCVGVDWIGPAEGDDRRRSPGRIASSSKLTERADAHLKECACQFSAPISNRRQLDRPLVDLVLMLKSCTRFLRRAEWRSGPQRI